MTLRPVPGQMAGLRITGDGAIGAMGCCLAVGALFFGIYMNVHGPSENLGKSHDFSVFAQLAPRAAPSDRPKPVRNDLDMTATASIPRRPAPADEAAGKVIASIILAAADTEAATLVIDGRVRTVHVGDEVPGAGAVLAILPGRHPEVRMSRGLIRGAPGE